MKITWTIAALACSVTLVNAQQSPRRPTQTAKPSAPAPKPRVQITEPWVTPFASTELELLAPGQTPLPSITPLDLDFPMLAPRPGQTPRALEFSMLAPVPGQLPLAFEFPMAPMPPMEPMVPLTPMPPMEPMVPLTPMAPLAPAEPMIFDLLPGQQGPTPRPSSDRQLDAELRRLTAEIDRAEAAQRRALEQQDRAAQREIEMQLRNLQREVENAERNRAMQERQILREIEMQDRQAQRELERSIAQSVREAELHNRNIERAAELAVRHATADLAHSYNFRGDFNVTVPVGWAKQDVADSLWRQARELVNRGEYGQAAQAFRSIPQRYPNSEYAPEAAYYLAFSLFRIGGTAELREALAALEASKAKYPNSRSRAEAAALTTRIQGVLANRGDAQAAAALRATAASGQASTCDREDQAVQQEAMNQLFRMEGSNINELITRVLARKDECAIPLRRTAIFLVGQRRDAQATSVLAGVARSDPSVDVRVEAISVIARLANEEGVPVLEEMTRSDDERIQRAAIRALVRHPSARARTSVRSLVERDDVSEKLRSEALSAFDSERATADDVAWLRALYAKVTTSSLRSRTLAAITRIGGPEVDQWLVTLARDDNQPSEIRALAMRRIGESMSIPDLARLYDSATQQRFRSEIINVLGKRPEDGATDKLIDIVKNGTDPSLRRSALNAVVNKKDARTQQLLLEIINK